MNKKHAPAAGRPALQLLGTEPWRATREFLHLQISRLTQPEAPRGDGHPVVVFPGLASDHRPLAPLLKHCRRLGYEALDWGRGFNAGPRGNTDAWLQDLADELQRRLRGRHLAPSFIGWSLGGLYARELAKLPGLAVRQVITIGTPFNGSPQQTHAGWLYRLLGGSPDTLDPAMRRRLRTAPPVPTTSIYSRSDGIVAWQACRHEPLSRHHRPQHPVEDIEVHGSHLGMGWNPRVLAIVADRLAQDPDHWQPYAATHPEAVSSQRRAWARGLPNRGSHPAALQPSA